MKSAASCIRRWIHWKISWILSRCLPASRPSWTVPTTRSTCWFCDYRLPGISGVELMQKVRQVHPDVKVILIAGKTDPRIRKEVPSRANAFFIKPVPIADFLDSVERHLGLVKTILPPEPIVPVKKWISASTCRILWSICAWNWKRLPSCF